MKENFKTSRGLPYPFGVSSEQDGINFSLFSQHATQVSLCLFKPEESTPFSEISLDPKINKTGDVWHIFIHELPKHYHYGYRIDGPYDPFQGHYFDKRMILIDPYAKQVVSPNRWGTLPAKSYINRAVISPSNHFDWEDDKHPNIPFNELIIYEMHVRGFTQDPSSKVKDAGTFLGMIEKIPYLKELGVNAVELMPIHEFNERESLLKNPKTGMPLFNFWGYSTINFFSPMNRFAQSDALKEFKMLVKSLHAAGIEVILDVVFNHTAEGNQEGPFYSFKGIENSVYYMLAPDGQYYNFTGCGNTVNCNHPVVRELIKECLRYWVIETHVDGFRFDLASVLVRSHDGIPLANPPLIEALTVDPILANVKLIAEAWDAGGLYQVGSFPGMGRWAEWNGKYRDSIRKFVKGTDDELGAFATRVCGSEDLYGRDRLPHHSINFITAHDGFTLADLVSYNGKHNEENGENNRDGMNDNESWNCGSEGATEDPAILKLRLKQMKNFHLVLMISQGVPMILMGDEYGHTKLGNNNTWGHDSRLNWFQWDTLEKNQDFFRFYKMMIYLRKNHPVLRRARFLTPADIIWHGIEPGKADWRPKNRFIACSLIDALEKYTLYMAFNASFNEITVELPDSKTPWRQLVYTDLDAPQDISEEIEARELSEKTFTLAPYSSLILKGKNS